MRRNWSSTDQAGRGALDRSTTGPRSRRNRRSAWAASGKGAWPLCTTPQMSQISASWSLAISDRPEMRRGSDIGPGSHGPGTESTGAAQLHHGGFGGSAAGLFAHRARLAEQEALGIVDGVIQKLHHRLFTLDPFGNQVEAVAGQQLLEVLGRDGGAGAAHA